MSISFEEFCGGQLMNDTLLLDNWWPELTTCLQSTLLIWVPCGFLWLSSLVYIPYVMSLEGQYRLPFSRLNLIKTICSIILTTLRLVDLCYTIFQNGRKETFASSVFLAYILQALNYILTIIILQIDRVRGRRTNGLLFIFWTLSMIAQVVPVYTYIILQDDDTSLLLPITMYVSYALVVLQFALQWISDGPPQQSGYQPIGGRPCPETNASFPSRLIFWWMTRLIITGYRRDLEESDLWDLNPRDQSKTLIPPFEREWSKEVATVHRYNKSILDTGKNAIYSNGSNKTVSLISRKSYNSFGKKECTSSRNMTPSESTPLSNGYTGNVTGQINRKSASLKKPSLMKVLFRLYRWKLLLLCVNKTISDIFMVAGPVVMSQLMDVIGLTTPGQEWKGYVLGIALVGTSLFRSLFYQASVNQAAIQGLQIKSVLIGAIYKKALTLNNETKKTTTTGEIVNQMSVDCQRINDVMNYVYLLFTVPIQILLSVVILYVTMGSAAFAGLVFLLVMIPVNLLVAIKQDKLLETNITFMDKRIKLLGEVLSGIKVLKLYSWETSFKEKVEAIRSKEVGALLRIAYLNTFTGMGFMVAPFLVTFATFATYILIDPSRQLTANTAFVTLSLFNIIRVPMTLISLVMSYSIQSLISINRVNAFLCKPDLDPDNVKVDSNADHAISIDEGNFTWDRMQSITLKSINLHVAPGSLVAVVGAVGCGKSSLISAILGDMDKVSGRVTVQSHMAYVPQQAWIQNATLRDNILFGKKWRERKYKAVIEACALEPDLAMLEAGDQTEIGEKGINLSGGQKQRVSLARAVYSNSDIYLFDDPLSAVDSHVGKHIFSKVMGSKGLLKSKTRILVTHGVHWLPMVDLIVVLNDGQITEAGSYEELMTRNGHFAQFLKIYLIEKDLEDSDEDSETQSIRDAMADRLESVLSDSGDESITRRKRRRSQRDETSWKERSLSLSLKMELAKVAKEDKGLLRKGRLTQIESVETGKVQWSVFCMYGRAAGLPTLTLSLVLMVVFQSINAWSSFYLIGWTDDPYLSNTSVLARDDYIALNEEYLDLYSAFGLVMIIVVLVQGYLFWTRMVRAASRLHSAILSRVFRSPMSFFDTTPLGRIINRMSRDVETIDNTLPQIIRMFLNTFTIVSATLVVICINTPMFITVMIPLFILYYFCQSFYIPTSRQLKRIESVTRTPIYTHFSETITGASSIRAYRATDRFIDESKRRVDTNQVFYFGGTVANRWLAFNVDLLGTVIIFAAVVFALLTPGVSVGAVGMSVSYSLQVSSVLGWMVRQLSDLETNIVSVERVKEYSELETEAAAILPHSRPPINWPETGTLEMRNYMTKYREGLDLVLKGLTCTVEGGQKIGIVGRTGAGKSSFTLALFRILESTGGAIIIDGVNIADIGLHDLRSRLTILPQDPLLFSGPLRMNLDPLDEFNDEDIWRALGRAHLKAFTVEAPGQLMYECGEGGENLSVGQRQLVCLARALLRHSKVLILDEATAAVDMGTDSLIQVTIREAFSDCTIITVAHRLNTIMDYDKVMVMAGGLIKEFDSPEDLLKDKSTIFYGMAKDAGLL